jgi:UDP-glucose 4-epimerase
MSASAPGDVVVLGNTGFIGRAVQAHFADRGVPARGFSSAALDLRQPSALARLDGCVDRDTCLIVTAVTAPGSGMTPAALADNVLMVANLATYLETHPTRMCVYLSSDAVYPMIQDPVTEATPTDVTSFYALAKYAGERVLEHATRKAGTALLVLRPTAVYGPGDTHDAYGPNRFARSCARGQAIQLFGQGEETRDHLYIDDLVRVIAGLSARGEGGLFNVATGRSHSFMAVAETLRGLAPDACEIVTTPRRTAVTHRRFDVSRLLAALPGLQFTPLEVGLEATLAAAKQTGGDG